MQMLKKGRVGPSRVRSAMAVGLAALMAGSALAATADAEEKRPAVSINNSTIESNVRVTGTTLHQVVGSNNTAETVLGVRMRGANASNSTIRSNVRITGIQSHTVVGSNNTSYHGLGVDISN